MAFKRSESVSDISMGSENWNVADGYSKLKILRHLILLDRFDTIAQFGTEDMDEDIRMDDNLLNKRRVEGLQRFSSVLLQLMGNTKFAVLARDRQRMLNFISRVKNCSEYLPRTFSSYTDTVTREDVFEINEDIFYKILNIFQDVKDELNIVLNNANLIFRPSEEMDLDKIMNDIISGG